MAKFKYLMTEAETRALQYVMNADYAVPVSTFDEDHQPIGAELRSRLVPKFLSHASDDQLRLTEEGMAMIMGDY